MNKKWKWSEYNPKQVFIRTSEDYKEEMSDKHVM